MTDALAVIHKFDGRLKYKPDMVPRMIEHMSQGYGIIETASYLGLHVETLYDWTDFESPRYKPELSEALKLGEQLCRTWWLQQGKEGLRDRNFNTSLWIFNAKNRLGWRDATDVTSDGKPISFVNSVPRPTIDVT